MAPQPMLGLLGFLGDLLGFLGFISFFMRQSSKFKDIEPEISHRPGFPQIYPAKT